MIPLVVAAAVIALDRLTKAMVVQRLVPGQSVPVLPGVFHITHVRNTGGAFGLLQGKAVLFTTVGFLVVVVLLVFAPRLFRVGFLPSLAAALLAAGAGGNLIDRVTRQYVVDFLDFQVWPVFNVADISIVLGCSLLGLYIWRTSGDAAEGGYH